jgi:hypothetical protein
MASANAPGATGPKPLVSPVTEFRLLGLGFLVDGIALGVVTMIVEPNKWLAFLVLFAAFCGVGLYLFFRHFVRLAADNASTAPTPLREVLGVTRRRVILVAGALLIYMAALSAIVKISELASGACLALAFVCLALSRWLWRWEQRHSACLLREPRFKWGKGQNSRGYYI